jgi:hypothetical protein
MATGDGEQGVSMLAPLIRHSLITIRCSPPSYVTLVFGRQYGGSRFEARSSPLAQVRSLSFSAPTER